MGIFGVKAVLLKTI